MRKKLKFLYGALALVLLLAVAGIGIYAAVVGTNTISGTITVNASGYEVEITVYKDSVAPGNVVCAKQTSRMGVNLNLGAQEFDLEHANVIGDVDDIELIFRVENKASVDLGVYFSTAVPVGALTNANAATMVKTALNMSATGESTVVYENAISAALTGYSRSPYQGYVDLYMTLSLNNFYDEAITALIQNLYLNIEAYNSNLASEQTVEQPSEVTVSSNVSVSSEYDVSVEYSNGNEELEPNGLTANGTVASPVIQDFVVSSDGYTDLVFAVTNNEDFALGVYFYNAGNVAEQATLANIKYGHSKLTVFDDNETGYANKLDAEYSFYHHIPAGQTEYLHVYLRLDKTNADNLTANLDLQINVEQYVSNFTTGDDAYLASGFVKFDPNMESIPIFGEQEDDKKQIIKEANTNITAVVIPYGMTTQLNVEALFCGCENLVAISLPNTITTLADFGFQATGLQSIIIPSSVTTIGRYALSMTPLQSIVIPETVVNFNTEGQFYYCDNLTSVVLPSGLTEYGAGMFAITGLTSWVVPSSVTTIGRLAFNSCPNLTSITLNEGLEIISEKAFAASDALLSITIPSTVTYIGERGINGANLTTVVVNTTSLTDDYFFPVYEGLHWEKNGVEVEYIYAGAAGRGTYVKVPNQQQVQVTESYAVTQADFYSNTGVTLPDIAHVNAGHNDYGIVITAEEGYSVDLNEVQTIIYNSFAEQGLEYVLIDEEHSFYGYQNVSYQFGAMVYGSELYVQFQEIQPQEPEFEQTTINNVVYRVMYYEEMGGYIALVEGWTEGVATNLVIPSSIQYQDTNYSVLGIDMGAFDGSSIVSVTIPSSVMSIVSSAFDNCASLSQIVVNSTSLESACSLPASQNPYAVWYKNNEICEAIPAENSNGTYTLVDTSILANQIRYVIVEDENNSENNYLEVVGYVGESPVVSIPASVEYEEGKYLPVKSIGAAAFAIYDPFLAQQLIQMGQLNSEYTGCVALTSVSIPDSITQFGAMAFAAQQKLTTVTISNSSNLETIGFYAFMMCENLTTINLPESLTTIGMAAFSGCMRLRSITLPSHLETIGNSAFSGTGLRTITVPASVTSIELAAFGLCADLYQVTIESTHLAQFPQEYQNPTIFDGYLTWYKDDSNEPLVSFGYGEDAYGVYSRKLTESTASDFTYELNGDGTLTITAYTGDAKIVVIPEQAEYNNEMHTVKEIAAGVFAYGGTPETAAELAMMNITGINVAIESVIMPNTITSIGDFAFALQTNLYCIAIPNSVENIGIYAFAATGLYMVALPSGMSTITSYMLAECQNLSAVFIPDNITTVNESAFGYCNYLNYVSFKGNLTNVYSNILTGSNSLMAVYIASMSEGVEIQLPTSSDNQYWLFNTNSRVYQDIATVGGYYTKYIPQNQGGSQQEKPNENYAFEETVNGIVYRFGTGDNKAMIVGYENLSTNTLEISPTVNYENKVYTVYEISEYAFNGASITSVIIPASVVSIGSYAFENCYNLASITLNDGLESINDSAFANTDITSITIPSSVKYISSNAFNGCYGLVTVVNNSSETIYLDSYYFPCSWQNRSTKEIDDSIGTQGTFDKYEVESVDSDFDYNTEDGKAYIISYNGNANRIVIPSTLGGYPVTKVQYLTDNYETKRKITSIVIPASVKEISSGAFTDLWRVTSVTLNEGLETIRSDAFRYLQNLKNITIPASVTLIEAGAFSGCSRLVVTVNAQNAVYNSSNNCNAIIETATNKLVAGFSTTVIPNTVTEIGNRAFSGQSRLETITIPSSVSSFGENVFEECSNLRAIIVNATSIEKAFTLPQLTEEYYWTKSGAFVTEIGKNDSQGEYIREDNPEVEYQGLKYEIYVTNGYAIVVRQEINEKQKEQEMPNTYTIATQVQWEENSQWYNVTKIGDSAFNGYTNLTSIVIPSNITLIGNNAFGGCSNLQTVTLNTGLQDIFSYAFGGCTSLTSITIPSSVTYIADSAFNNCTNLTTIVMNTSYQFKLPKVGGKHWENSNHETVTYANATGTYTLVNGVSYTYLEQNVIKDGVIYDLTTDYEAIVVGYSGESTSVSLPKGFSHTLSGQSKSDYFNVETIATGAFSQTSVTTIEIQLVSYLMEGAFNGSSITQINLRCQLSSAYTLPVVAGHTWYREGKEPVNTMQYSGTYELQNDN